jgi:hypothetical protein
VFVMMDYSNNNLAISGTYGGPIVTDPMALGVLIGEAPTRQASATNGARNIVDDAVAAAPNGTNRNIVQATIAANTPTFLTVPGSGEATIPDWSASATFVWTPAVANPSYQLIAWVRSAGDTADTFESYTLLAFPVTGP